MDFTADGRNSGKDGQQLQLLIQEANLLMTKPNLVSILCYAFEKQDSKVQCCVFEVNLAPPLYLGGPGHFPWPGIMALYLGFLRNNRVHVEVRYIEPFILDTLATLS